MDDPRENTWPSDHAVGHDAAVILSLLAKMHDKRDVPVIEVQSVEDQVPVIMWGRWPW